MGISLVACIQWDENNKGEFDYKHLGIGYGGDLLWKIPDDMKRFRELTANHPIIMGRLTYESIGRPLPKRTNIVVSPRYCYEGEYDKVDGLENRNRLKLDELTLASSISGAMTKARLSPGSEEVFIIGGSGIYRDFLPFADKMYLTLVPSLREADTWFPRWTNEQWEAIYERQEEFEGEPYKFVTLQRKS